MFITEDGKLTRTNVDDNRQTFNTLRQNPENLEIDDMSMMMYYTTNNGKQILKEPINIAPNGKVFLVARVLSLFNTNDRP